MKFAYQALAMKTDRRDNKERCKNRRFAIIALFLLILYSCVSQQSYPTDWPPLNSLDNDKCPNISGRYSDAGEMTNKTKVSLSDVFGKSKLKITHVEIKQANEDTLQMLFWDSDNLVDESIYSIGHKCLPEGIPIRLVSRVYFPIKDAKGITPVSMNSFTVVLTKNINGELVIGYTYSSMEMVFFVFPVANSASDYLRFKQKEKSD